MAKAKKQTAKKTSAAKKKTNAKGQSAEFDIVELILMDHKPLKKLIKVLKGDAEIDEKEPAFEKFAPLLLGHAEPEEESLYVNMKSEEDLRVEAYEGDTEHAIASGLIEQIYATDDEDIWMAKVKVLAELVEHHIEEEEEEMLPDVKKHMDIEMRVAAGREYIRLRDEFFKDEQLDAFENTGMVPNKDEKSKKKPGAEKRAR